MQVPSCFTVQSCYGHFVRDQSHNDKNLDPVSSFPEGVQPFRYRLAYMVFCIEDGMRGHALQDDLQSMTAIDPMYIQFGSASWFWRTKPNTYVVQLEPLRGACLDEVLVTLDEAYHIERLREQFFRRLGEIAYRSIPG